MFKNLRDSQEGIHKTGGAWTAFSVNISLIIVIFSLGIFIGLAVRNDQLINQEIKARAVAYFQSIVVTRRWNASYGGVFVEKKEGVVSNPYLENPDIEAVDGRIYTKKNPALMTREISVVAESGGLFVFRITSLKPLNPHNLADEFERTALTRFEQGEREYWIKVDEKDSTRFRYMAPLYVEKGCLQCHAKQGYQLGDVRGGISVNLDITDVEHSLRLNRIVIFSLAALSLVVLLGVIYFFIIRLVKRVREAQKRIEEMAVTDELTKLYNRRYFFERFSAEMDRARRYGHPVTCLMVDIDYFKKVNDTYGHQAGDEVLKAVAAVLRSSCRKSDVSARYGGEELALILPETEGNGALIAGEKLRKAVEDLNTTADGTLVKVTVSIGLATFKPGDQCTVDSCEDLLKIADSALYRAKSGGRNRVEVGVVSSS